jgi:hypothetical protein
MLFAFIFFHIHLSVYFGMNHFAKEHILKKKKKEKKKITVAA